MIAFFAKFLFADSIDVPLKGNPSLGKDRYKAAIVSRPMTNILMILLTILSFPGSVDAADKVRISISNLSGQFMTFPLAHKRGFLKEEGIEAEIIRVTGGAGSAALSSGDLDYGTGMAVGGAMTGLPVKVVACFVPAPVLALVARAEVKSIHELQGQDSRDFDLWRCLDFRGAGHGQAFRA